MEPHPSLSGEARALVRISRSFDRPGLLGFVTFILPIILDGIFNGIAPRVFGPNTIAMLQRDGISFRGVAWRKRRDRVLQSITLAAACTLASTAIKAAVRVLAPRLSSVKAVSGLGAGLVAALAVVKVRPLPVGPRGTPRRRQGRPPSLMTSHSPWPSHC